MKRLLALITVVAWCTGASAVLAQTGGGYDLSRHTIAGGGATFSTGAGYTLGGTVGQPDAGVVSAGTYSLRGGFWPGVISSAMPAPTSTVVVTPTGTLSVTPPSPTTTPTLEPTETVTATAMATQTGAVPLATDTPTSLVGTPTTTPTPTAIATGAETATPTPTPLCVGDCSLDMTVTVDELLAMVNIALGNALVTTCDAGDLNHDGQVTVDEILAAVNYALIGCPGP
jgi:hypothetical protein